MRSAALRDLSHDIFGLATYLVTYFVPATSLLTTSPLYFSAHIIQPSPHNSPLSPHTSSTLTGVNGLGTRACGCGFIRWVHALCYC